MLCHTCLRQVGVKRKRAGRRRREWEGETTGEIQSPDLFSWVGMVD